MKRRTRQLESWFRYDPATGRILEKHTGDAPLPEPTSPKWRQGPGQKVRLPVMDHSPGREFRFDPAHPQRGPHRKERLVLRGPRQLQVDEVGVYRGFVRGREISGIAIDVSGTPAELPLELSWANPAKVQITVTDPHYIANDLVVRIAGGRPNGPPSRG